LAADEFERGVVASKTLDQLRVHAFHLRLGIAPQRSSAQFLGLIARSPASLRRQDN